MSAVINVGVIGVGGMGARHARNLAQQVGNARLSAVMDVDQNRARSVAEECGGADIYSDAEALIAADNVAAVVITTPDSTHANLTKKCITASKSVLCEKPLATSAEEAHGVVDAELASGKRMVQLGFMREYDPAHRAALQTVTSGAIGKPLLFRGVHNNPGRPEPRDMVDVITNSAIHDIHSARFMMPGEITSVSAQSIPARADQPDSSRLVCIQLQFNDGSLGIIQCNADSGFGYEVDVEITGETGIVHTNGLTSAIVRKAGQRSQTIEDDWLQRFDTAYIIETREWIQSLIEAKPTGPTAWDGYVSLMIADACIESVRTGKAQTVASPETPAIYR